MFSGAKMTDKPSIITLILLERRWLTFPETTESPSPRTEHAMCTVADKIYILGGQLELDADDEAGTVFILDTSMYIIILSEQCPDHLNSGEDNQVFLLHTGTNVLTRGLCFPI
jgi:hypothetical protein